MTNYLCLIGSLFVSLCFFTEATLASPSTIWRNDATPPGAAITASNSHFISFRVVEVQEKVLVSWEATNTRQVAYYLVERRTATGKYLSIGGVNVSHSGASPYLDFVDQMPRQRDGAIIYRIKQVMKNGEVNYSPEQILYQLKTQAVRVYPDTQRNLLELEFDQTQPESYEVNLIDLQGKKIEAHTVDMNQNPLGRFQLPVGHLSRGMYIVRIESSSHFWTQRIVIP